MLSSCCTWCCQILSAVCTAAFLTILDTAGSTLQLGPPLRSRMQRETPQCSRKCKDSPLVCIHLPNYSLTCRQSTPKKQNNKATCSGHQKVNSCKIAFSQATQCNSNGQSNFSWTDVSYPHVNLHEVSWAHASSCFVTVFTVRGDEAAQSDYAIFHEELRHF